MHPITISDVRLYPVGLPLVERLRTSYGAEPFKSAVIVEVTTTEGAVGWGECPTKMRPSYAYETMGTALHVMREFLVPALIGQRFNSPTEVPKCLAPMRGHPMAKAALEAAVWDAWAKANLIGLAEAFAKHLPEGNEPTGRALVGVSIGIQDSIDATMNIINKRIDQGYGRIKLKIEPGWDVELARAVREQYPDVSLMLDANSAYSLADADHLKKLDEFHLLMIEQPLGFTDIYEHSKLQPQLRTPVCLDESIHSAGDARLAIAIGACKIINLKPARVGGFTESLEVYKVCAEHEIPLWIGGLLETGVGRAANLAFASLPGVNLPCDISATDRYYQRDLTEPPFVLGPNSTIEVPEGHGIAVDIKRDRVLEAQSYWFANYPYRHELGEKR
ncbi:MAG: o-succinylbenzoate synthase [Chloroflexi bacterium]|nr:o-succinylbenzoate synthase [Chloroflexota bacterium]MBV6435933.1 o-succinylbenzoate synthase [Anaerolineae bacterium]MDL1915401.1 o-succinylbenzoate synthase [Anaerolineae bacterium CFX4]OQY82272.1 MAG: o-succinylbenzoate synthase [Anaerolineae bacterium UTCFX5]RIK23178.1 MAG: o-succinylbenzoate synthase [Chloroflexota bacterium]